MDELSDCVRSEFIGGGGRDLTGTNLIARGEEARATVERMAEALEQCAARLQIHIRHSEDLCAHMVACEALAAYRGEQA